MRSLFATALESRLGAGEDIYLLTGDLGFSVLDSIKNNYPAHFINAGIAEQNMIGVGTGLALESNRVFCYSITNFVTFRCLEQIKNGPCYHNLPVTMVAVGVGTPYSHYGYTHMGIEDISIMRILPNIKVYSPASNLELEYCMEDIFARSGPSYLRLGKSSDQSLQAKLKTSKAGFSVFNSSSSNIAIVTTGIITAEAVQAAEALNAQGHSVTVYSLFMLSPLPEGFMVMLAERHKTIVVVEEHIKSGGVFSILAEAAVEKRLSLHLSSLSVGHECIYTPLAEATIRSRSLLDRPGIITYIQSIWGSK